MGWNTREELLHQAVTLHAQGLSRRAIARALSVSRNTVRKLIVEHGAARREPHAALVLAPARAPRVSKLDEYRTKAGDLLGRYPEITAQRVFEELRGAGFVGGYTAVKKLVRVLRPPAAPTPSLTTPLYGVGEMAESDWSPHNISFTDGTRALLQFFAYVLAHSRRKSFSFFDRCDLHALMDGHQVAFARFHGAAHRCKYDSQKPVVLGWEGRQPIYNPRFIAFATHYQFRPEACRPRHPNDKPHVERAFWEFERSFLNGRSFRNREDLSAQLAAWERKVCDARVNKATRRTPVEMFEAEERAKLVPLPLHPYDTARVVYRICSIDGFVAWEGNRYSVPYEHVTDFVPMRITQDELFVYAADLACIARHALAPRGAGRTVAPPGTHQPWRTAAADPDQLRAAFGSLGPGAASYYEGLLVAAPRFAAHQARQILLLRERFQSDDLDKALAHALSYGAFEHQAIARILAARAAPRTLAEYVTEESTRRLEERLGVSKTSPRDLAEYDRLPHTSTATHTEEPACPSEQPPTSSPTGSAGTSKSSG
jgi:transposase